MLILLSIGTAECVLLYIQSCAGSGDYCVVFSDSCQLSSGGLISSSHYSDPPGFCTACPSQQHSSCPVMAVLPLGSWPAGGGRHLQCYSATILLLLLLLLPQPTEAQCREYADDLEHVGWRVCGCCSHSLQLVL